MAYVPPTFDASAQSWANLGTRGFHGFVNSYVAALTSETPTAAANQLVGQLLAANQADRPLQRAKNIVDNYVNGKSDKTNAKLQVYDLQLAYGSIATALAEIGVLIDAN